MSLLARYSSPCSECGETIQADEPIRHAHGEWAHAVCPELLAYRVDGVACQECWTIPATNGECGCDA